MWVTRTLAARGVPTSEVFAADRGDTPTQTVITHRDAQGMIISVLNDSPLRNPPEPAGVVERCHLYEINTVFAADLLKDGGDEALAQLMETYHPVSGSPLDIPAIELDLNQFEVDESGSSPETRSGPEEEPGEPPL